MAPSPALGPLIDPIFADYAKPGVPGCAVGVYRAGEVAFARGYGLADLEHDVPIDKDTVFEIASTSKQFMAMAVLLLAEDGKLSLQDDVRKYVPELPSYGRTIRIDHLLHHTSGLGDLVPLLAMNGFGPTAATSEFDALAALARQKRLNSVTGTQFLYSNSGYFLLSLIVKRVTGAPWAELARKRIFEPLGMKSSLVIEDRATLIPHRAIGYLPLPDAHTEKSGYARSDCNWKPTGWVGVQTTVADLARWDANFYRPIVGNAHVLQFLRTPGKLDTGETIPWGAGLKVETEGGLVSEAHTGSFGGFRSAIVRFPSERLTVATVCNADDANAPALTQSVLDVLLPKHAAAVAEEKALAKRSLSLSSSPPAAMTKETLAASLGAYYDPHTFEVRVLRKEGDRVLLEFTTTPGGDHRMLTPNGSASFASDGSDAIYRFDSTNRSLTRLSPGEEARTFVRFVPLPPPDARTLAAYEGRITSEEALSDEDVAIGPGGLEWRLHGGEQTDPPWTPFARDLFTLGDSALTFQRDAKGAIRGFVLTMDKVAGVTFTRVKPR